MLHLHSHLFRRLTWSVAVSGALVAGCDRDEPTTPPVPDAAPAAAAGENAQGAADTSADVDADAPLADQAMPAAATIGPATTAPAAQKQIEMVKMLINEDKLDVAEPKLAELEARKATLPASLQAEVDEIRRTFDAARKRDKASGVLERLVQ